MTRINAYLRFSGNCREAMTFYQACLGGELTLQTVAESPVAGQLPPEAQQNIMHANLTRGDLVLLSSDMLGLEGRIKGNAVVLLIDCSSEEEIQTFFSRLSEGGKVTYPLSKEFWGATFGQLTDRFGVDWMLNYEKK